MFKSKLNELCQKRRWAMPEYEKTGSFGPGHSLLFRASVTVNGTTFTGPEEPLFGTLKEAQNEAARIALDFFTSSNSMPSFAEAKEELITNITKPKDVGPAAPSLSTPTDDSYKTLLRNYAEKNNLGIPVYDKESVTMGHSRRFHASVTLGSQSFETPHLCDVAADAEEEVARVALKSFTSDENIGIDLKNYKNLLSMLALGHPGPKYETNAGGLPHSRTFLSIVEIDGERFEGDIMNTKKQAENSAAKVAWTKLNERKQNKTSSLSDTATGKVNEPLFEGIKANHFNRKPTLNIEGEKMPMPAGSRITVVPEKTRSLLPEGSKLLPFSDEVWVAALVE
ncbi:double-stranded RNA-binding protein 1-like isoform X2 [Wolffia australiana]